MNFIDNFPSEKEEIALDRNQHLEHLLNETKSKITRGDLTQAYHSYMALSLLSFSNPSLLEASFKNKILDVSVSFLDSLQKRINVDNNILYHRIHFYTKFRYKWAINSFDKNSQSIPERASDLYKVINKFEIEVQTLSHVFSKEELIEIEFHFEFYKNIFGTTIPQSNMVDLGTSLLDHGIKFYHYILSRPKVFDKLQFTLLCYFNGSNLLEIGEVEKAEEVGKFGLNLAEEIQFKLTISTTALVLANSYRQKGNLDLALKYYQNMIAIKGLPFTSHAYPIRYIGYILQTRGELDQALRYFHISLNSFEYVNQKTPIARTLQDISNIYYLRGNFNMALEFNQQSIDIDAKTIPQNSRFTVDLLYHRILILLEQDNIIQTNELILKIAGIYDKFPNPMTEQQYLLSKALILKKGKRRRHKTESQDILEKIVNSTVLNHEFTVVAIQHMCELLIDEMNDGINDEIFNETTYAIENLLNLADKQQLHQVKINTLLLQARFDIIKENFQDGLSKISEAQTMCETKQLNQLLERVINFRTKYLKEVEKWRLVFQENKSIKERIKNKEIQDYIKLALSTISTEEV